MRKVVLGGVGAVLVACLVAVSLSLAASDSNDDPRRTARAEDRAGPRVLRGSDAVPAVEGEDYEVLRRIQGSLAHRAELLLPDGDLVLVHGNRYSRATGRTLPDEIAIWDPRTGAREELPRGRGTRFDVDPYYELTATSARDLWVSWNQGPVPGSGNDGWQERRVMHYDRTSGEYRVFTAPRVARARSGLRAGHLRPGGDGRLYFMTGRQCNPYACPGAHARELWSFDPVAPGRVRKEAQGAAEFAVSDRLLAWVVYQGGTRTVLRVRELGRARVHEAIVSSCALSSVGLPAVLAAGDAVLTGCGGAYDDRARRLASFRFSDTHGLAGVSTDRWLAYGRTVFDVRTGRLLRVAEERLWHDRRVVMTDDHILFPTGTTPRNTRGGTWTLARLEAD